ncbi:hypothetical protein IFM89_026284 [Coptis chinensis]|uniref:Thiol-disulfide oxidoreductase DCC n=1 Tax=Coptis chinensis TaxID=261450 RepID=A0A835MFZ2_9MAGN|nr:hypothetical protein IFM89_026284 [Coptis chinensis]
MALRGVVRVGRGGGINNLCIPRMIVRTNFYYNASASASAAGLICLFRPSQGGRNRNTLPTFQQRIRAINTETTVEPKPPVKEDEQWRIKMLYDGECPLCLKEVNMLKERNKEYNTIKFVDISSDDYTPEENQGLDYETAMGSIHAIQSDGTVVTDIEAFRRLYEEVGLGWVYAITKYEPIGAVANAVYGFWAKYRMQITGRPPLEDVFEARRKNRGEVCRDKSPDI